MRGIHVTPRPFAIITPQVANSMTQSHFVLAFLATSGVLRTQGASGVILANQ